MDDKHFKDLQASIELSKKALTQLDNQVENLDNIFSATIEGLGGEDKQKVQELQAMVNKTISIARKGGSTEEAMEALKAKFKTV